MNTCILLCDKYRNRAKRYRSPLFDVFWIT